MIQRPLRLPDIHRLRRYLPALLLLPSLLLACNPPDHPIQSGGKTDCGTFDGQQKIDARLCRVLREIQASDAVKNGADLSTLSTPFVRVDRFGRIEAYVKVTQSDASVLTALHRLGMVIERVNPERRIVQGWVPFSALNDLAAQEVVERIEPPSYGSPK